MVLEAIRRKCTRSDRFLGAGGVVRLGMRLRNVRRSKTLDYFDRSIELAIRLHTEQV